MKALHQVRAVALTDYASVARSVGLDGDAMLLRCGIDGSMLEDPDFGLPAFKVAGLLEESANQSGCESFGVMMAERRNFQSLGRLAGVLERLPSLREVVASAMSHRRQLNDVFELEIVDEPDRSFIKVGVLPQFARVQATDLVIAMTHVLLKGASRGGWKPRQLSLRRFRPDDTTIFERFFAAPIQFESAVDCFECDRETLDRSWGGDPEIAAADLIETLQQLLAELWRASADEELMESLMQTIAEVRASLHPPNH